MAQRTETDLRELTDLVKGLSSKIESLDRKVEQSFVEVDKKIEKGFTDADKKIEALDKKMDLRFQEVEKKIDLGFQEVDKKMDLGFQDVNNKIDKLDLRLNIMNTTVSGLDNCLWAFGGIALSVTLGSLLTVFARYIFTDSPKF
jgi:predicted RNase H-like nuclease (RuvC/YqgF family)